MAERWASALLQRWPRYASLRLQRLKPPHLPLRLLRCEGLRRALPVTALQMRHITHRCTMSDNMIHMSDKTHGSLLTRSLHQTMASDP